MKVEIKMSMDTNKERKKRETRRRRKKPDRLSNSV
jgi:hypothetical protein